MKTKFIFSIFIVISTMNLHAQDFAPVGAKWYFPDYSYLPPDTSVTVIESINDTIINGLNCKHLVKDSWSCFLREGDYFIHQNGDTILLYDANRDTFDMIIDFAAEVGESWQFYNNHLGWNEFIDTIKCTVDSVYYQSISATDSLRVQVVTLLSQNDFYVDNGDTIYNQSTERIIEKIGFQTALFPYLYPFDLICDANSEGPIRCYEDSEIGLINFSNVTCDYDPPPVTFRNFARWGTKWYFPTTCAFSSNTGLVTYESVGDTTINGKLSRKIIRNGFTCYIPFSGAFYVYEEGDIIELYYPDLDTFQTIIDFGAEVGETWQIDISYGIAPDTFECRVDSISINSDVSPFINLNIQHVTLTSMNNFYVSGSDTIYYSFQNKIIEKIGFERALLPIGDSFICDGKFEQPIRCYDEIDLGLIQFDTVACDFTPTEDFISNNDLTIFPNPTSDRIFFQTEQLELLGVQFFSLEGKLLKSVQLEIPELDVSEISSGIYFLKINTAQGLVVKKVVLE